MAPNLIGLDLSLASLIDIAEKRKKIFTCTKEATRAKLERLYSVRLIHHGQIITTRHAKALIKAKGLISLLAPTLNTIKHHFSQTKLITIRRFASQSKHAKVSKQYSLSLSHDYKVVMIIHIVIITTL
jgi:hypothetical protein